MAELVTQNENGVMVVNFASASIVDAQMASRIYDELNSVIDRGTFDRLLLDFKRVPLVTSAMIGELLKLRQKCEAEKIQLKLCNMSDDLKTLFKRLKLHKQFDIKKDRESAIKSFR